MHHHHHMAGAGQFGQVQMGNFGQVGYQPSNPWGTPGMVNQFGQINQPGQMPGIYRPPNQQFNSQPQSNAMSATVASVILNANALHTLKQDKAAALNVIEGVPMYDDLAEVMTQPCRIMCCCCFCCYWASRSNVRCLRSCGYRRPYTGTLLHWAVYYDNLGYVKTLVELGANLDARMNTGETPLTYAKHIGAGHEIISYLEKAKTNRGAPTSEDMERNSNHLIEKMAQKRKHYACFLSHHKRDAAAVATMLRGDLAETLHLDPNYVFLDTEDLRDLRSLRDAVKNSLVLVVLLTKDILTRPWCLAEIYTAIENQIPIVSIKIEGQENPYNFEKSMAFLQQPDFRAALESVNPGAVGELEHQGIDVAHMGAEISSMLPYIISKKYDVSDTQRIRAAQLQEVAQIILEKV